MSFFHYLEFTVGMIFGGALVALAALHYAQAVDATAFERGRNYERARINRINAEKQQ